MSRITSIWVLFLMTSFSQAMADGRPNILFIFADDQSFDTINALGNEEIETPNLDRLAKRGTTFTHAYNMGSWSGAVCIASRTMLNTGRFVWNAYAVYNDSERERREGRWWSEYFKAAGYRTYMTGKWHLRASANAAFDVARDIRPGMPKTVPESYNRPRADEPDRWSPTDQSIGGFWEGGTHWSQVVADHAADFLSEAARRDEPFFMYLAFNAPHDPRQSPAEFVDRYPVDSIRLPENFQSSYPYADAIGCGEGLRDERLAPFPRTPYAIKVHRREYFAAITYMDVMVGQIINALEATGKADNTWVFFSADHGLAVGQHGLIGKQNMYDHSVRVPFIVVGPGVTADQRIDDPIYLQDVMPTSLAVAGIRQPRHVEFHSLLPMLEGRGSPYEEIYGCYLDKQRSIRTDQYKLIAYPEAKILRLYDIRSDPLETNDLSGQAAMSATVKTLFGRLLELQKQMNDDLDLMSMAP